MDAETELVKTVVHIAGDVDPTDLQQRCTLCGCDLLGVQQPPFAAGQYVGRIDYAISRTFTTYTIGGRNQDPRCDGAAASEFFQPSKDKFKVS